MQPITINLAIQISGDKASVSAESALNQLQSEPFLDTTKVLNRATMGLGTFVNGRYFADTPDGRREAAREKRRKLRQNI